MSFDAGRLRRQVTVAVPTDECTALGKGTPLWLA